MTISADIKPHETYLRNGTRLRYAAEIADRTLLFLPLNPADGASAWTPTETEWEKELAAGKIKRFFVIRDAKGDVVRDATQIEIAPSKNETKKENRARSLFFFMKEWHKRKASGTISLHHPALYDLVHDEDNLKAAKKLGLGWLPASGTLHR
jgi:hypothetical protein